MKNTFINESARDDNIVLTARINKISRRGDDVRTEYYRDYLRILHSTAYRRLKHKTQVFSSPENDHITTRIEHVNHVLSVSYTIAKYLGLNTELTSAIAIGHDVGHPPFGHKGEEYLNEIIGGNRKNKIFWHEKNSLNILDNIEWLSNESGEKENLNLTYSVRDGIICHCGEIDNNVLFPRKELIELESITKAGETNPYTWEGCVVRIADKISYLGRDIEDALELKIISKEQLNDFKSQLEKEINSEIKDLNNTFLVHTLTTDICMNSNPDIGICLTDRCSDLINNVKTFNYENIYSHKRLENYNNYTKIILQTIFNILYDCNANDYYKTIENIKALPYNKLSKSFSDWLYKYSINNPEQTYTTKKIYDLSNEADYKKSIIDFISGMTDNYILNVFNEINTF